MFPWIVSDLLSTLLESDAYVVHVIVIHRDINQERRNTLELGGSSQPTSIKAPSLPDFDL